MKKRNGCPAQYLRSDGYHVATPARVSGKKKKIEFKTPIRLLVDLIVYCPVISRYICRHVAISVRRLDNSK